MDSLTQVRKVLPFSGTGSRQILFGEQNTGTPATKKKSIAVTAVPQAVLGNWNRLYRAQLPDRVYKRVRQLARYEDGWRGFGSKALTAEALRTFLNFWIQIGSHASAPEIALTARGTLQAEWFKSSHRHLDLEFVNDQKIFFGWFDDENVNEGVYSLGGLVQWLNIPDARAMWSRGK
jgi:hypothetical protein